MRYIAALVILFFLAATPAGAYYGGSNCFGCNGEIDYWYGGSSYQYSNPPPVYYGNGYYGHDNGYQKKWKKQYDYYPQQYVYYEYVPVQPVYYYEQRFW